jgi:hypothetical protein
LSLGVRERLELLSQVMESNKAISTRIQIYKWKSRFIDAFCGVDGSFDREGLNGWLKKNIHPNLSFLALQQLSMALVPIARIPAPFGRQICFRIEPVPELMDVTAAPPSGPPMADFGAHGLRPITPAPSPLSAAEEDFWAGLIEQGTREENERKISQVVEARRGGAQGAQAPGAPALPVAPRQELGAASRPTEISCFELFTRAEELRAQGLTGVTATPLDGGPPIEVGVEQWSAARWPDVEDYPTATLSWGALEASILR